jgi:hypothetical protein
VAKANTAATLEYHVFSILLKRIGKDVPNRSVNASSRFQSVKKGRLIADTVIIH